MSESTAPPVPPPRNVNRVAPVQALPPMYAPNSAVPKFIRLLAILVFLVGGTTAALITFVYKNFVFPKLLQTLEARTALYASHQESYTKLLGQIARLALGKGGKLIAPHMSDQAQSVLDKQAKKGVAAEGNEKKEKVVEVVVEPERPSAAVEPVAKPTTEDATPDEAPAPAHPAPLVFIPLIDSIKALTAVIPPPPPAVPLLQSANTSPTSVLALSASLTVLTDYIESETFASASSAYRTYGATFGNAPNPSSVGQEQRNLFEVVANFKSEIRAVKGALLNRRNFTQRAV